MVLLMIDQDFLRLGKHFLIQNQGPVLVPSQPGCNFKEIVSILKRILLDELMDVLLEPCATGSGIGHGIVHREERIIDGLLSTCRIDVAYGGFPIAQHALTFARHLRWSAFSIVSEPGYLLWKEAEERPSTLIYSGAIHNELNYQGSKSTSSVGERVRKPRVALRAHDRSEAAVCNIRSAVPAIPKLARCKADSRPLFHQILQSLHSICHARVLQVVLQHAKLSLETDGPSRYYLAKGLWIRDRLT